MIVLRALRVRGWGVGSRHFSQFLQTLQSAILPMEARPAPLAEVIFLHGGNAAGIPKLRHSPIDAVGERTNPQVASSKTQG